MENNETRRALIWQTVTTLHDALCDSRSDMSDDNEHVREQTAALYHAACRAWRREFGGRL